jgi:hypothetical protein
MADEPQDPKNEEAPSEQLENLRKNSDDLSSRERFKRISNIALLMSYDLIDKLRYWEKVTLELSEDQIAERADHLAASVEQLREAYLAFSDLDL